MTYTFKYGADIAVGNQITLGLPNWANTVTLSTSSTCGSTSWLLSTANSGSTYSVTLQAATANFSAGTSCSVVIQGLTNPSVKLPANYASITAAVSGTTPAQSATAISTTPELVAKLHEDSISFSLPTSGQITQAIYSFTYGANIGIGNQITLTLPNWATAGTIVSYSTCGTSNTSWTITASNTGASFSVTLQASLATLIAGEACSVRFGPLRNPYSSVTSNDASINARVTGAEPSQADTPILRTQSIMMLQIHVNFGHGIDTNNGLSSASPVKTVERAVAISFAKARILLEGSEAHIISKPLVLNATTGSRIFYGNNVTAANVTCSGSFVPFSCTSSINVTAENLEVQGCGDQSQHGGFSMPQIGAM